MKKKSNPIVESMYSKYTIPTGKNTRQTLKESSSNAMNLNEDWSKGLCFIYKVDTKSLITACKNNVGMLGTYTPEKYIGDKNQSFRLPKRYTLFTLDRTQVDFDYGQSEITVFWGDEDFTYKEMGGKGNFRKAKLTAEMNDVLESGRKELEDFGIIVNQCKVEVGGSDKFDSTWRQAQDYNESLKESMQEIDRKYFASLNKEGDGHYYILVDGNYEKDFYADSDEEAKKKFQQYLRKNESLSLKEDYEQDSFLSQIKQALSTIIYRARNDGDVFDNRNIEQFHDVTYLGDCANWLDKNVPEVAPILERIRDAYTIEQYYDYIITPLVKYFKQLDSDGSKYENMPPVGDVFNCGGDYGITPYEEYYQSDYYDLDESLTEARNEEFFIIMPSDRRYDDLTDDDYKMFALKYGIFTTQKDCWNKIEELAPDRWDAFIPVRLSESLTEARNPEHEKANEIIRKKKDYSTLSKEEKEEIKKFGIDPSTMHFDSRWYNRMMLGPNGKHLTADDIDGAEDAFDYVGYLTKQHNDKEIDPIDTLQPYRKEKEAIKKAGASERNAQKRKLAAIQAAKEKHQKKNESLSLKEDWTHFEFTSGSNPYIATTEKEKNRMLRKYKGRIQEVKPGFYKVDDRNL